MVNIMDDPYAFPDESLENEEPRVLDHYTSDVRHQQQQTSRRKQSKPIRVKHETEAPGLANDTISTDHMTENQVEDIYPNERMSYSKETMEEAFQQSRLYDETSARSKLEELANNYPTEYHRLGRQLNSPKPDEEAPKEYNDDWGDPEEGRPVKRDEHTKKPIFRLDAFCDICDREFCNKYFLKTHLASKHGIYENIPQSQSESLPEPSQNYIFSLSGPPSMIPQSESLDYQTRPAASSESFRRTPSPPPLRSSMFSPFPSKSDIPSAFTMASPFDVTKYSPPMPQKPELPMDTSLPKLNDIDKQKLQGGTDDFCELCQKHFCNKYYLRKHKMDVHGIHSDPYSARRRQSSNMSHHLASIPGMPPGFLPPSIPTSMANMMLMNPFHPFMGMHPAPPLPLPQIGAQPGEIIPKPKDPSRSPGTNTMSQSPVKNGDSYCEICKKEFCDKYYLRVHKANMHNIRTEEPMGLPPYNIPMPPEFDPYRLGIPHSAASAKPFPVEYTPEKEEAPRQSLEIQEERQTKLHDHSEIKEEHDYKQRGPEVIDYKQRAPEVMDYKQRAPEVMDYSKHEVPIKRELVQAPSPQVSAPSPQIPVPPLQTQASMSRTQARSPQVHPRSPQVQTRPERPRTCEICNKEFADKYALRMHRLNIHGQVFQRSRPPPEERKAKLMSIDERSSNSLPYAYPPANSSSFSMPPSRSSGSSGSDLPLPSMSLPSSFGLPFPPIPGTITDDAMDSMFSSMITAKLADRVSCDICNKDVCNKYFLKTHKVKMHGIDPATIKDPSPAKEYKKSKPFNFSSLMEEKKNLELPYPNDQAEYRDFLNTQTKLAATEIENPTSEELLKLGIDPEAYCEICKKEFCSKYFLRTHKLNMHGIPTDKPGNRKEDREISRREMMEREMREMTMGEFHYPRIESMYPSMYGSLPPQFLSSSSPQPSNYPGLTSLSEIKSSPPLVADEESKHSSDNNSTNSNKEPANMIRVQCDICGKEVCNRYFLRTHKMTKHGIIDEPLSEGQQRKFLELQKSMMYENPFLVQAKLASDPEFKRKHMDEMRKNFKGTNSPIPNIMGSMFSANPYLDQMKPKSEQPEFRSSDYTEECHICQRRFRSVDWLKTHMHIEHNIKDDIDLEHEMLLRREVTQPVCHICGMLFDNKIDVQLHMVHEHGIGINVMPEPNPTTKPDSDYDNMQGTAETNKDTTEENVKDTTKASDTNITASLRRKYTKILMKNKLFSCSHCDYKSRWINNIKLHEERQHGVVYIKRFNCKRCSKRFRLRSSLQKHIQSCQGPAKLSENIIKRQCNQCSQTFDSKLAYRKHLLNCRYEPSGRQKFQCEDCDFKTIFSRKYRHHIRTEHGRDDRPALVPVNGHCNGEVSVSDSPVNNDFSGRRTPVCYSTPCDLKTQNSFVMQAFRLKDGDRFNHFVGAIVYLPVYEKINEPITVDFHLTPTEA